MASSPSGNEWTLLVGAAGCVANGLYGLKRGKVMFFNRTVAKSEDNAEFWTGVIFSIALGILGFAIFLSEIL